MNLFNGVAFINAIEKYQNAAMFLKMKQMFDPLGLFSSKWTDAVLGLGGNLTIDTEGCALEGLCICSKDVHCFPTKDIVSWKREELVDIPPRIMHDRRYFPYFQHCIGAIDGTHLRVHVGGDKKITYWNHHNYTSMNILAVCEFNMRFIYTRIGVPGRAHDSKILTYCARHDNFFPFPSSEKYFLVDSGYPNRRGFLAPYRGESYHPNHFSGRRPGTVRKTFNKRHSLLRSVIERTFGVWKGKWSILEGRVRYDVQMQEKIVAATMALHNFIRDSNIEDDDFNAAEETENYDADREGNMSPSHDDNVVDRNYDPTADQYMSTVRDDIAREIWDAR
ncbi:PREDICTED: uncharacterized protein LOC104767795 [Camelina sativa]|uniref:Uncharacterized protein LOC104767795 n=1 Tax=Camelina sativa TaxID=90675 RepID=A0ABM0XRX3_CAMSA|nr:PREDICTED: uncharacterized protein LOC104767795 [Camelina sativa]